MVGDRQRTGRGARRPDGRPRQREPADVRPHRRKGAVLPRPGEEIQPVARCEPGSRVVLPYPAEALEEVALFRPILHYLGRLLRALVVEGRASDGERPVRDLLRRFIEGLEHHEDMAQRPAVETTDDDRVDPAGLRRREGLLELVEGRRHAEAELLKRCLVVEDAEHLGLLRNTPQRPFGPRRAVGRPAQHVERRRRAEAGFPSVRLRVVVEGDDQPGLDERGVHRVALVALVHVRRVGRRRRELDRSDVVIEGLGRPLDRHVRVHVVEGLVQRVHLARRAGRGLSIPLG